MFFIIIFNYYPIRETSEFQKPNFRIFVQIRPRSLSFCLPIRLKSYGISHNFNPLSMGYPVTKAPLSYGISRNEMSSVFMGYPINFVPIVFQIPIANKKQLQPEINLKPELYFIYGYVSMTCGLTVTCSSWHFSNVHRE